MNIEHKYDVKKIKKDSFFFFFFLSNLKQYCLFVLKKLIDINK